MEKKKLNIAIAAGVLILVAAGIGGYFYYPIYTIQEVVRKPLLDPVSAQFSEVKFYRSTGYGCGYVNAKNKVGGYVGRKQFVASLDGQVVIDPTKELKDMPDSTPSVEMPSFSTSFSMEAALADSSRRLADAQRRYAETMRVSAENDRIRAEAEAFKSLVAQKCQ